MDKQQEEKENGSKNEENRRNVEGVSQREGRICFARLYERIQIRYGYSAGRKMIKILQVGRTYIVKKDGFIILSTNNKAEVFRALKKVA